MEFHISRQARKRYHFEDSLFSFDGNVIFANFHAARVFAQRMNEVRNTLPTLTGGTFRPDQRTGPDRRDHALHGWVVPHAHESGPYDDMINWLEKSIGRRKLNTTIRAFLKRFPPVPVYQGKMDLSTFLKGESDGIPHRAAAVEELLMLWLVTRTRRSSLIRNYSTIAN
jgi:hypothetical protein